MSDGAGATVFAAALLAHAHGPVGVLFKWIADSGQPGLEDARIVRR